MKNSILGAIARGWCSPKNSHKEMDTTLAEAIADEVMKVIDAKFTSDNSDYAKSMLSKKCHTCGSTHPVLKCSYCDTEIDFA